MSLFSRAVKFINDRKKVLSSDVAMDGEYVIQDKELEFDFSLRNYAKESFSVLIVKPFSKCMQKVLRAMSFVITGILFGALIAAIICVIIFQFGSLENSVISSTLISKLEKVCDEADLSIKSAMVNWNRNTNEFELDLKKVTIDDLVIPRLTIVPDYMQSFKQNKLIAKSISIIKPKIALEVSNDFKKFEFNPNWGKGSVNKALFEPIFSFQRLKDAFKGSKLELINADISILENGQQWDLKNVYCNYNIGDKFPDVLDFSIILPGQKYPSGIKTTKISRKGLETYKIKLDSVNPLPIHTHFAGRNPSLEKLMAFISGYNLPVSGDITVSFDKKFRKPNCKFDLYASSGCIRLPSRNTLSLNLGKHIDSGNISGSISNEQLLIDSISVNYGSSGMQLTGMSAPLSDYRFLDIVNMDGTLSFTNIDIKEMESILPKGIAKSVIPAFKTYLPGFKLDLFKVDVNGSIAFGNRMSKDGLKIGQGVFKIHDAQIPLDERTVTNVVAVGNINHRGIDVRLSNALLGNTKINSGVFFVSNEDNSWIGDVNVDVSLDDIQAYGKEISPKLASLPLNKLKLNGTANLDMKLVRVSGDKLRKKHLPFRIAKGEGTVKSSNNTKTLNLSWDSEKLSVVGDIASGKSIVHININDNFKTGVGTGKYNFTGDSDFLTALMPKHFRCFSGDFDLDMNNSWNKYEDSSDFLINLKNAAVSIPSIGDIKSKNENGTFKAHVSKYKDGNVLSKIHLDTKDAEIDGQVTFDKYNNISECVLNTFRINDCSAKINMLRKDDSHTILSIVGDRMDLSRMIAVFNQAKKNMRFSTYLNLKSLIFSSSEKMNNVKGTLEILNSNVVGGECVGVIGKNTTVALTSKKIDEEKDCLISISASNAGDLLKYIGFTDTVSGGSANFVLKSSLISDGSFSGGFEIKDFIVKNNNNLNRLISLSSSFAGNMSENSAIGFNSCLGNVTVSKDLIKINECRLIGPTMSISCKGTYDRVNDNFSSNGILLPAHSFINNGGVPGALVANYRLFGPIGMISVSVDPLRFVENELLIKEFGNLIPVLTYRRSISELQEPDISSVSQEESADPFEQKAFDKAIERNIKKIKVKPKKTVDKKYGVRINRGIRS